MQGTLSCQLTVIMLTQCGSENFRMALEHLRNQTISHRLEVIVVAPSKEALRLDPGDSEGLFDLKILELGSLGDWGQAKTAGVMAASTSLVAFIEDHSYPEAGWAEALVKAHAKGDFAGVGPIMRNANPSSIVSWCCFLIFYSPWMKALPLEEVKHLPGNQSSYKSNLLLEYGPRLPDMLQAESVLHWDLLAKGHQLYQEEKAIVYHLNYSLMGPMITEYYYASWVFAANRVQSWKTSTKIVYALGSPLLPFVRLWRILKDLRRNHVEPALFFKALISMFITLGAGALGEMLGYALGPGKGKERLMKFEKRRSTYITDQDLKEVAGLTAS